MVVTDRSHERIMRILITGASSSIGTGVLQHLLLNSDAEIWCGRHRKEVQVSHPRVHIVDLDLASDVHAALSGLQFDLVVHVAGLTHSSDAEAYWKVNLEGTRRLALAVRANGCRRFVYVSTRCAVSGSGHYGESKLATENELQQFEWTSLLIIRPAEVYGGESTEGIDRLMATARKWRIVPTLFGHPNLSFAPIHIDDFCKLVARLILEMKDGLTIEEIYGPEELSGIMLARRVGTTYHALPIPLWWPLADFCFRALHKFGFDVVKLDQLDRLVCRKTATAKSSLRTPEVRRFLLE